MNIRNHLNLKNAHGHGGCIAIYDGPRLASTSPGDIVLATPERSCDTYTIEKPYSQEQIEKNRAKGNRLTTHSCCVNVPGRCLTFVIT